MTWKISETGELRRVFRNSLFLRERLDETSGTERTSEQQLEDWLADWREALGGEDRFLERCFEWDGLDRETVREKLLHLPVANRKVEQLAQRATELLDVCDASPSHPLPDLPETLLDSDAPLPFEDAYLPFVQLAFAEILPALSDNISPTARGKLCRNLLRQYADIGKQTLYEHFSDRRTAGQNFLLALKAPSESPSTDIYEQFVEDLLDGQWRELFTSYPVLARLMVEETDRWQTNTRRFVERLRADREEIEKRFFGGERMHEVTDLQVGCSDPHFAGQSVIILHFGQDRKLVYKPKPVDIEATFSRFLQWCNDNLPLGLYAHRVLPREDYGWVEFIDYQECRDQQEVEDYYYRSGELLALAHGLGCTDLHQENIVAHGSQPVIIDYESLFHGQNHWIDELYSPAAGGTEEQFQHSVLRCVFLPVWREHQGERIEIGGLSAQQNPTSTLVKGFKAPNTDDMHYGKTEANKTQAQNGVLLDSEHQPVTKYRDQLIDGFQTGYEFLLDHRAHIESEWLPTFAGQTLRFIFRNTSTYFQLRKQLLSPSCLRNGVDFAIQLESVRRPSLKPASKPDTWALHHAEKRQMRNLDIPYFGVLSDDVRLSVGVERPIEGFLIQSGIDYARDILDDLSHEECDFQVQLINGVLETAPGKPMLPDYEHQTLDDVGDHNDIDSTEEAHRLVTKILDQAIEQPDGGFTWMDLQTDMARDISHFAPLQDDLYGGKTGVAFFLAAQDYLDDDEPNREIVDAISASLRRKITDNLEGSGASPLFDSPGGYDGLGSYIYFFNHLSRFYDDPAPRELALQIAENIQESNLQRDDVYDLTAGTAGLLQTLLSLYASTGEPVVIEKARWCGEYLLENQEPVSGNGAAWDTIGEFPVTGMAHGAAGILMALHRLFEATGEERFLEAVEKALAFERSVFQEKDGNWPDFRTYNPYKDDPEETPYMVTWCAGAPGIVLSRLKLWGKLDDPELKGEILSGLRTLQTKGPKWSYDHLCCGDVGRYEIVRQAHAKPAIAPHIDISPSQLTALLHNLTTKAQERGHYRLVGKDMEPKGLMSGLAGIGYTLLRWQNPDQLPDVLTLE